MSPECWHLEHLLFCANPAGSDACFLCSGDLLKSCAGRCVALSKCPVLVLGENVGGKGLNLWKKGGFWKVKVSLYYFLKFLY
jgi:hypothetical protein